MPRKKNQEQDPIELSSRPAGSPPPTEPLDDQIERFAPLAERQRPRTIEQVIGHRDMLGPGRPLFQMASSGKLHSMILWGPPGSGKTTIAQLMARSIDAAFFMLSAVNSTVKDLRESIAEAQTANATAKARSVLFVDEIHRFNKAQQDALLSAVERGIVTLIGATTENPSFEVISPLLSRARVYVLQPLSAEDLGDIIDKALREDDELQGVTLDDEARKALMLLSGGDARKLLNALELSAQLAPNKVITHEVVEQSIGRKISRYDKGGEEHYNVISAFIKSMRGSDPNAALYYLARMIDAGEDLEFIARRMIIFASEDIGNADPNALLLAIACWDAVRAIGYPEATIVFGHVVTYLATTQKSNASYMAVWDALENVRKQPNLPVPLHLRNAPTKLMKDLGYHKGYKYAHDFEGNFARNMQYLPEEIQEKKFYEPGTSGREKVILDRLQYLWPEKYPKPNKDNDTK
jgi:putative ATPase